MRIGDFVKLKDDIVNNTKYLYAYKGKIGQVIDMQPNKKHYRVSFHGSEPEYEDLGAWRLELAAKTS